MKRFLTSLIVVFAAFAASFAQSDKDTKKPEKITAEELVAKHLASVGTPEALAAARSRVLVGKGTVTSIKGYIGSLSGPVQLASDADRMLFVMMLNSKDYPYEKAAFDGKNSSIGLPNGQRTAFSEFLKAKSSVLEEGLFTGSLSSKWPLLNLKSKKVGRIEYGGVVKSGERYLYKLKYSPRGDNLRVSLFFETDTFRHVMTEYYYTVDIQIGRSSTDIQSQKDYYTMTEQFGDFKRAGDLTLPFRYTIALDVREHAGENANDVVSGPRVPTGSGSLSFTISLGQVYYNEQLEAGVFKVS